MSPAELKALPAEMHAGFQRVFEILFVVDPARDPDTLHSCQLLLGYLGRRARHHRLPDEVFSVILLADQVVERMLARTLLPC